jgi:sugar transferase (PEP-CTERM/EpsH1 system associated)
MRILFLTQRFPFPPDRGDRIRSYHILRHLAGRHTVSLASLTEEEIGEKQWDGVRDLCTSIDVGLIRRRRRRLLSLLYLPTTVPLTLPNYHSNDLRKKVDRRLREESFDLLYIYCSSMAPYVMGCSRVPKVIDFVDMDSEKWCEYARSAKFPMNMLYTREGRLLRRYEKKVAKDCVHAFVTSRREKDIFERFRTGTPISTISNGVEIAERTGTRRYNANIIFTGVMDYWPNEHAVCHFVHDIFPIISKELPDSEFVIVGQKPTRRVRQLSLTRGVSVTGWVPDPGVYMDEATVFVAPIQIARGVQNKVLEAMARGVPVVATAAAADGLEAVGGRDFLEGNSPEEFATQTLRLLRDAGLREQLARNAIGYIREKHNWTSNLTVMDDVLENIVESEGGIGANVL